MTPREVSSEQADQWRDLGLWADETAYDVVSREATRRPDDPAVLTDHVELTYADVVERVDTLAAFLAERGVADRDQVSVQFPNWWQILGVHLATSAVGGRFLSLHHKWRTRETSHLLEKTETTVWMVPETYRGFDYLSFVEELGAELDSLETVVVFRDDASTDVDLPGVDVFNEADVFAGDWSSGRAALADRDSPPVDDGAHVLVSSGTTSLPTPSLWSENNLHALGRQYRDTIAMTDEDVAGGLAPLGTGATGYVYPVLYPLMEGATSVIMEDWTSPEDGLELLVERGCTYGLAIPTQLTQMMKAETFEDHDYEALRVFSNGGAPLPRSTAETVEEVMDCKVHTFYGASEAGVPTMIDVEADPREKRVSTVGRVLPGEELRVVNQYDEDVDPGEEGEVVWRGANNTLGLLNSPEAEADDWFGDGWFRSGDAGVIDEEGYLRIVGRKSEMILRGGRNINPGEIENELLTHPAIREAAVAPMPDPEFGEKACAFVVLGSDESLTFEEMIAHLKDRDLTVWKLPERLEVLSELPKSEGGKIKKPELTELVTDKLLAEGELTEEQLSELH